ncbi:MAG: hypothetical protein Q8J61_07875 [Sulfuricella sp.]|nr:hypothetical protein [Sulfuricella sp.]
MNPQEMKDRLNRALDALFEADDYLLAVDSSERSVSHCLAVHLMREVPGYNVDCEYNRDGFDVKRLELPERPTTDDNVEAVTVFPDIIIHQRGTNERNLLAIEMKKGSSTVSADYDIQKLKAFRQELKYAYAAHVTVGKRSTGEPIRKVIWVNG